MIDCRDIRPGGGLRLLRAGSNRARAEQRGGSGTEGSARDQHGSPLCRKSITPRMPKTPGNISIGSVQKSVRSSILASLGLSVFCLPVFAARSTVKICVRDQRGDAIAGDSMNMQAGASPALSDNSGCAVLEAAPGARVEITHAGFTPVTETIDSLQQPLIVVMHVAGAPET